MEPRIQTFSGRFMYPFDPEPDMVNILDIAHALSQTNRFAGHTRFPYSVAQHSVAVRDYIKAKGGTEEQQLQGLLHDSSEAYLLDIPSPLKAHFEGYKEAEDKLLNVIFEKVGCGVSHRLDPVVHEADAFMLKVEKRDLMKVGVGGGGFNLSFGDFLKIRTFPVTTQMRPKQARRLFMEAYQDLTDSILARRGDG